MTLKMRVGFFIRSLQQLLALDPSGGFVAERIASELASAQSSQAKILRRVVPAGSWRYTVAVKAFVVAMKLVPPGSRRYRAAVKGAIFGLRVLRVVMRRGRRQVETPLGPVPEVVAVTSSTLPLVFEPSPNPDVAIVIPVYGNWALTEHCLRSLLVFPEKTPHRIIVVDDASPDDTAERLRAVVGIEVVTHEQNQGFLKAVANGVAASDEEMVVLLNNDTTVSPGWLDALVARMRSDASIGLVGSMLLYPNGLLQEAGGIVFNDGTGNNFGKGDRADRSWYQTPRDVDYCSGACLLIRRSVWDRVGGFDDRFAPAYYEDTDLAFATRAAGSRVVFEPASKIYHFEGGSYGSDDGPKKRALMTTNKPAFVAKWRDALAEQADPHPATWVGASWRSAAGRILIVDSYVPLTDQDSGSIRMAGIIAIFQEMGFAVSFMAMSMALTEPYTSALRERGVEVLSGLVDYADEIARLAPSLRFAWLSRPDEATTTASIIAKLAPQAKIIYDTIDLHYVREARRSEIEGRPEIMAIADEYRRKELAMMRAADATIVVTPAEQELLATDAPGVDVRVVSNIHSPLPAGPGFADRSGLLFVGNFNHLPNRDAITWFAEDILPLVRASLPEVSLSVVGSNMPPAILELARPGLDIVGWVHDLAPIYDQTRVVVAPLRFGAGIKGKLGEAAMHGVPFVCTEIASEGTYLEDGTNCLIGNDAATFAAKVVELYHDAARWQRLADEGRAAISKQCAPEVAALAISALLRDLGIDRSGA